MPTIRQLAELAGVSHSTISRALRDDPRISEETRLRIRTLAESYHFRPNRLAQGALSGKTATLGCILNDVSLPFESRLLRGILSTAYTESYRVIVLETQQQLPRARQAIHALVEQRVEGLLITSCHREPIPREALLEIRSHGAVPLALDFVPIEGEIDRFCTDEAQLGEIAVEYLYGLGHRHIAYLGPLEPARGARARAIQTALRRRGCSVAHVLDWGVGRVVDHYVDFDANHVLTHFIAHRPFPTAVICWEDRVAGKLIHAATRRGFSVPGDLSVMGCANLNVTEFITPALTSIEQHPEEMGHRACRRLLEQLSGGEQGRMRMAGYDTMLVTPSLVIRESCAPPRRRYGK